MKKKFVVILLLISCGHAYCGESKILNAIGKYMPNFTEIAFVTDIVNVYMQVSGFVRATNTLLKSVKSTQQQWTMMTAQIDEMYGTIKSLRDIDLYNMDSWSQTLERGEIFLRYDMADLLQSFNMLEYYSLGGTERYLQQIKELKDYQLALESRTKKVKKLFLTDEYQNALSSFSGALDNYKKTTKEILESLLASETQIYINETDSDKKALAQTRMKELEQQISNIDQSFQNQYCTKLDTIMDESSNMIAANLTEIQLSAQKITEMQDNALSLIDSYERLKRGNISTNKKKNIINSDPSIDLNKYDSMDPDKVPAPASPANVKPKETKMKVAGNEDVKNMANAVDYLLLKQEALMRDLEILKCNTMAFIVSVEAFKQNAIEQDVFVMAHGGKVLERRMHK